MNIDPDVENLAESLLKSGLASSIEDAIPKAEKMLNKEKKPADVGESSDDSGAAEDPSQTSLSEHRKEA